MVCVSQLDSDMYFIFLMATLNSISCFPYSFCNLLIYLIYLVTAGIDNDFISTGQAVH